MVAVDRNGKSVDIGGVGFDLMVGAHLTVADHGLGEKVAQDFEIIAIDQAINQAGMSGLAGETFCSDTAAGAVPHGSAKGRIVSKFIGIILPGVSADEAVETGAQEFGIWIANMGLQARIVKFVSEVFGDADLRYRS